MWATVLQATVRIMNNTPEGPILRDCYSGLPMTNRSVSAVAPGAVE